MIRTSARPYAGDDITITASQDGTDVLVNGESTGVSPAEVTSIEVEGGPLANRIDISGITTADFPQLTEVSVDGNDGDDILIGSEMDDDLDGGSGNDYIDGEDGSDSLRGHSGDDTLMGGEGDDSLGGHAGDDDLDGEEGDDTLGGGSDDDDLDGGDGDDEIRAGSGHDWARGGTGRDFVRGGKGRDLLQGGGGHDRIAGQDGSDVIDGEGGNDQLSGNRGRDRLNGGAGRDKLRGGSSNDLLRGGADDDYLAGGRGDDLLDGDEGDDAELYGRSVEVESDFVATLASGDIVGEAEFELAEDGDIEMEFELEVENATPGTYEVFIDDVFIGDLMVDADGEGEMELSTDPDDAGETSLPADFPTIAHGSTIEVRNLVSGTFSEEADTDDDNNDWDGSAELAPLDSSSAAGDVDFGVDEGLRRFEISFEDVAPGTYDLIVDDIVVASVTIEDDYHELEFDDEDPELAFPENFPTLSPGSVIELDGVLSAQL